MFIHRINRVNNNMYKGNIKRSGAVGSSVAS